MMNIASLLWAQAFKLMSVLNYTVTLVPIECVSGYPYQFRRPSKQWSRFTRCKDLVTSSPVKWAVFQFEAALLPHGKYICPHRRPIYFVVHYADNAHRHTTIMQRIRFDKLVYIKYSATSLDGDKSTLCSSMFGRVTAAGDKLLRSHTRLFIVPFTSMSRFKWETKTYEHSQLRTSEILIHGFLRWDRDGPRREPHQRCLKTDQPVKHVAKRLRTY